MSMLDQLKEAPVAASVPGFPEWKIVGITVEVRDLLVELAEAYAQCMTLGEMGRWDELRVQENRCEAAMERLLA